MLIKLAALGALGYAGYSYLKKQGPRARTTPAPEREEPQIRVAGGPLSSQATVQHSPAPPPA